MQKIDKPHLNDILDAMRKCRLSIDNVSQEEFVSSPDHWQARHLTERMLEIISEASRRISADLKSKAPQLPWQKIADLGNRLRHEYHRIDEVALYKIATENLNDLEQQCLEWLREIEQKESL